MSDGTFACPDLTAFCRLDELGLVVTGQRLEPGRAVLACRVVEPDGWCRRCGCEGVPHDTVTRELAHEPLGWRPTRLVVRVRRYRCTGCGHVWRQDTSRAAEPRARLSRRALRWAGAITRTAQDSFDLGMRGLGGHVDSLTAAVTFIDARLDAPVGSEVRALDRPAARPVKGYASEAERFAKSRRKAQLEARLADATKHRAQGRPRIVAGGGHLWRGRANLDQAQMTRAQRERNWTDGRMFLTADGKGGKRLGNETIRVTDAGVLQVKMPGALAGDLGARLTITAPDSLSTHCGGERSDRIIGNHAIRYDLHRSERGRCHLDPSWNYTDAPTVPLAALQTRRTLGADLNDGHTRGPGAPEPSLGPHPRRRQTSDGQDHRRVP